MGVIVRLCYGRVVHDLQRISQNGFLVFRYESVKAEVSWLYLSNLDYDTPITRVKDRLVCPGGSPLSAYYNSDL